jgi:hypothetical protein
MASSKAAGSPVPQHAVPFQGNCCASGLPNWMGHERAVRATRLCGSDSIQVLRYPPNYPSEYPYFSRCFT